MRVLLLLTSSELGGAERSLTRMVASSGGSSVRYTIGTLDGEGRWHRWAKRLGLDPVAFGGRAPRRRHGSFGLRAVLATIEYCRAERIDVVYVIGFRATLVLRFLKWALGGARLVQGVRWNPSSSTRLDRLFRFTERFAGGLVDLYIVNSGASAATLERSCGVRSERIEIIHNGLDDSDGDIAIDTDTDTDTDTDLGAGAAVRSLETRPFHVVTVANLSPRKGHLEYLDGIASVLERRPDARFYFVGRDDLGGRVQRAIRAAGLESSVCCTGFQDDVSRYLREARLFVLPSLRGEGCPTSILEAFRWGVPVVAYAVDGVPELIESGEDGLLVPPGDREALSDAIVDLLGDVGRSRQLARRARQKLNECFSVRSCSDRHRAVLEAAVLGGSGPSPLHRRGRAESPH